MKAIITGSKGFIGKRLVAALTAAGAEVCGIDLGDDITKLEGEWDVLYNLAWVGKGGALRADYNVQMNNVKVALDNYREAQRLKCKRYICTGTVGENMVKLPECEKIKSQNFIYAISKNYLHAVLNSIGTDDCRVIWATLGNLYGGSDAGGNIIDYTLRTILEDKEAQFGPAEQPYDFIHVDDAVRALALLGISEDVTSDAFYIGNGDPQPLIDYLWKIGEVAGKPDLIGIGKRPDDGTRYRAEWFSTTRLQSETAFQPTISFEVGVRMNIEALK